MELKLLLTLALVAYTSAGPITNQETCSRKCTDTNKFGYKAGTTYEYDYTTNVETSIQGASEDISELQLTAKVYIDVVSKCEMNLRLGNVRLTESDPKSPKTKISARRDEEFRRSLEESPLAFSFQDGRIEELCTSKPEKTWVLNIKRGILSAIQNTMADLTVDEQTKEADVNGECKAEYKMTNDGWLTRTIKKSKDLLACVNRNGYNTVMQGTPYRVPSEIQSLPLVKSTHECTQDINKQGVIHSSRCEERHVLRPFSRDLSGAVTKTTQALVFVTSRTAPSDVLAIRERLPLTYAHASDNRGSMSEMIGKLNEICVSTSNRVRPETPKLFSDLVHLMKTLDSDDLPRVYAKIQSSSFCPSNKERVLKFFLDALPMAGNKACLRMMTELIDNKRVTGMEADMWFTTLSLIKNPTKDMLNEVKPLLSSEVSGKALLGVSSLINAYCKGNACENDLDIISMVSAIADKIGVGCYVDKNNFNTVMLSLRALGNAGHVTSALPTITRCISKKDNPVEVRLAAIQAFRRMPCSSNREEVAAVFKNRDEDSELRIAAYLALMTCPSDAVMSRVRYLLETEEVNQVGSFIWSHLTNLMETSSPFKQEIRIILNNEQLKKEFNLEKLKYSRNYEASFFLEKINTGASIDSNLIWSSKSFLPRSAMTNLTVDLFGHSVNFLEIGGRLEGLEYFLESYFGPNGYFQGNEANEAIKQSLNGISERKMENIDRQFGPEMDALKGDLYLRVFGNEMVYTRFTGLPDAKSINIMDIIDKLAGNQQYAYTQNYMFLDSSIIIPTVAGFPMNLTIEGSATIDLEASGKMDLKGLSKGSPTLAINGYIKPSGSILINSMMSVDAFVTYTGIKMVSTMHSSTSLEGHVEMSNGKVLSAEIKTPFDNMEVFNVKTSFFTIHQETEREQKMITANRQVKKACSGDKLAKITGMELCAELQYPNASLEANSPYFPLTGPISAAICLNKRDSQTGYNLEYKFVKDQSEARARIAFNTPGSKIDRELIFDTIIRPTEPVVEINMMSPWKKASIRGALVQDNQKKQLTGRVLIDNKDEYSVTAEWARTRKGSLYVYNPFIEIVIPNEENIRLSSKIEYTIGRSFDGELIVKGLSKHPIISKVSMVSKKVMKSLKSSISFQPGKEYIFETRLQRTETKKALKLIPFLSVRTPKEDVAAFGGSLEYKSGTLVLVDLTLDRLLDKPVKVYTKLVKTSRTSNSRYQSKIDIRTPFLRTKGLSNIVLKKASIIVRTSVDYVIPGGSRDKITVNSKVNYGFGNSAWSIKGKGSVNFKRNSNYNVEVSTVLLNKQKLTNVDFELQYGAKKNDQNKRIYVSTSIKHQWAWKASDLDLKGEIQHLASGVDLKFKGSHSHNKKGIDSNIALVYDKKKSVTATIVLKNKSKRFTVLNGDASLKINGKEFSLKNNFEQKNKRKFRNELLSNIAGYKTNINSDLKIDDDEYEISTDVVNAGNKPVHVEVALNLNPRNFKVRSLLNKDYSISLGSQYKKNSLLKVVGDLSVPSRRVTAQLEAKNNRPVYSSLIDVNWDASANTDKKVRIATEVSFSSLSDMSGFLDVRSPLQNNKLNIHRKNENAHFDFKSDGQEQLSVDTLLSRSQTKIIGGLTVQSKFKNLRYVKIDVDHMSDDVQYKTNIDVNWKPTNKIAVVLSLQKPVSMRQLKGSFEMKTPFEGSESLSLAIDHEVNAGLKSTLNAELNKKSIKIDASARKENDLYSAHARLQSDLPSVRSLTLDVSHKTSGNTNENSVIVEVNGDTYKYEGQLTHDRVGIMVQQNGRILLMSPIKRYETTWRHRNTREEISTSFMSNLDGKVYKADIDGTHKMSWNTANLQHTYKYSTPSGNGQLLVTHSHKDDSLNIVVALSENSRNILTSDNRLQIQYGGVVISSKLLSRGKQIFAIESDLKLGNTKTFNLIISTPLKVMQRVSTSAEFTGDLKSFSSSLSTEIAPIMGKVQLVTVFDSVRGLSGSMRLTTPFKEIPSSQVTFSQKTEKGKLNTDIKIEYLPMKVISLSTNTLLKGKQLDADFSIATPFDSMRSLNIGVSHTPTPNGCYTLMRMEYPAGKTYSVAMKNDYNDNYLSSLVIRRPDSHPITANIKHKGSLSQFVSGAELQYKADTIHKIDVSFSHGKKSQGRVDVSSPLIEPVSASFSHSGNLRNLNSDLMVKHGKNKPLKVSLDFINSKRIKIDLKATSPFTDDLSAMISHKGKPTNFRSKVKMNWGKKEEVNGDISFSLNKKLQADVSLATPFRNLRKISASVTHEGSPDNFKCHAEVKLGKRLWDAHIISKMNPILSSEIVIKTPHQGYESLRAAVTHDGRLSDFTCRLELSKEKQDITGDLKVKAYPFDLSSSLKTPFKNYRNMKAVFSHRGGLRKFETNAEVTYSDSKTVTAKASLDTESSIMASLDINTPFEGFNEISAQLTHSGSIKNFASRIEAVLQKRRHQLDLSFTSLGPVEGKLTLITPNYEPLEISISHKRDPKLESKANVLYGPKSVLDTSISLSVKPIIKGEVKAKLSNLPEVVISVEHDGDLSKCRTNIKSAFGEKYIEGNLQLNRERDFSIDLKLRTPFGILKTSKLSINHQGPIDSFMSRVDIEINSKKVQGDVNFSSRNGIQAAAKIITPFQKFQNAELLIKHRGNIRDFECNAEYIQNGEKADGQLTVSTSKGLSVRGLIRTPFTEEIEVKVNHDGKLWNFQSSTKLRYGYNVISSKLSVDTRRSLKIDANMKTPYTQDIIFSTETRGKPLDFNSHTELTYNGQKQHDMNVVFKHDGDIRSFTTSAEMVYNNKRSAATFFFDSKSGIEVRATLKSPIAEDIIVQMKQIGTLLNFNIDTEISYKGRNEHKANVAFLHEGSSKNFQTDLEITYNGEKASASLTFDARKDVIAKAKLLTPFTKELLISFTHNGVLNNFKCLLEVEYGFEKLHSMDAAFKLDGDLRKFESSASASLNRKTVMGDVSFDMTSDPEGSFGIKTPFTDEISGSFKHQGVINNFLSHGELHYLGQKQHEIDIAFQNYDVRKFAEIDYNKRKVSLEATLINQEDKSGRIILKTPYTKDIKLEAEYKGDLLNFNSLGRLSYGGQAQHEISVSFEHTGDRGNFRNTVDVEYNAKKVSTEVDFDSTYGLKLNAVLKSPYTEDILLKLESSGDLMDFNSKGSLSYAGRPQHEISVSFEHQGNKRTFRTTANAEYNRKKVSSEIKFDSSNGIKVSAILRTPFTKEIQGTCDLNGNLNDFSVRGTIRYGGSNEHELVMSYSKSGTIRKFKVSGSVEYNSKLASFSADIDTISRLMASIHVKTPNWSDVQLNTVLDGDLKNFEYKGDLTYSGKKQHDVVGKFKLDGDLRRFSASANSGYNGKEMSVNAELDTTRIVTGRILIKTPFTEDIMVDLKHNGQIKDFNSKININYLGKRQHELELTFSLNGKLRNFALLGSLSHNGQLVKTKLVLDTTNLINGQAIIESPITDPIDAKIDSSGSFLNLDSRATLSYGRSRRHEIILTTKHNNELNKYQSEVLLSYNGKAVSSDISFEMANGLQGKANIRSPFKDLKASVSHIAKGNIKKFTSTSSISLNGKEINGEIQLDTRNGLDVQAKLRTPFSDYESNTASLDYSEDNRVSKLKGTIQIGKQNAQFNALLDTTLGVTTEICMKTTSTEDFEIIFNGNGDIHALSIKSSISYGTQRVKANVDHEWTPRSVSGKMILSTPILDDIKVLYDITGNIKSFESTTSAFIGEENGIKEVAKLRLEEKLLLLESSTTTTLEGNSRTSLLNILHQGELSYFRSSLRAQTDDKKIKVDASFKNSPSIEATLSLQTPFEAIRDISGKFEHSGTVRSFRNSGSIQYAPDKKIEGKSKVNIDSLDAVDFNIEIQSPCSQVPQFTWRYMHDIKPESVVASTYIAPESNRPVLKSDLKITYKEVDISVNTPENKYVVKGDVATNSDRYLIAGNLARNSDMIVLSMEKSPSSISLTLNTPFRKLERTRLLAKATRDPLHIAFNLQGSYMPEIYFEAKFNRREPRGSLKLKSGIRHLNDIRINLEGREISNGNKIRIEAFLNQLEGIVTDLSASKGELLTSIQTPWASFRTVEATLKQDENRLLSTLTRNGKIAYDIELSVDREEKSIILNINEPKQMRFEISKLFSKETFILVNWNKNERESSCRLDSKFDEDKQAVAFKGTCGTKSYGLDASYENQPYSGTYRLSLSKDDVRTHKLQLELENSRRQKSQKISLQLPVRTLVLHKSQKDSYGRKVDETSFSWDADKDLNKRITLRKSGNSDDLNLELEMPSIGKDVKLDTKMQIGRGNVIYDGRTELKYSKDSRKTLTLSSKLEDVSGRGEKYNFLLGISHPYTTVDVQTKAEFGKTDDKISAALDIQYMTARRQRKNFALMTEIDRLRKQLDVQIRSPLKSMTMAAKVESSPYKLSIKNMYDNTKPINTELVVDPKRASLDFSMNYDLDNPSNALYVNAKFSDEQGIKAELYRDENGQKIVESLLNIRLKTSKILNTRIQWRPSLLRDLKDAIARKVEQYTIESGVVAVEAFEDILQEISYKRRLFRSAYDEEKKEYQQAVDDILEQIRQLRDRNDYHIGDLYKATEKVMDRVIESVDEMNEAWERSPLKEQIERTLDAKELKKMIKQLSSNVHIPAGENFVNLGSSAYNKVLESIDAVRKHPTIVSLKSQYDNYLDQIIQLRDTNQMVKQYSWVVPMVREKINKELVHTLPTPVYSMGSSAYKFWEVEENIKSLVIKAIDEIQEELLQEVSGLKDVVKHVMKSKVNAFDLQRGNIDIDIYLPVEIRTLSSIADISLRKYLPDLSQMIPKPPQLGSVEDYIPHMSWTGRAEIDGDHFRTFDGQEFDFRGRCSYILARDFINGNFSIILNYMGRQNKKLIVTSHKENVQIASSGKIRVDGKLSETPYKSSDFAVFSDELNVVIEGRGFQIKADKGLNKIDIDLSKWYFGRTGGLLGTLNHERYDDMMMPNKQITTDAFALGNAWQVQDRCR